MQWSPEPGAGFTEGTPWEPLQPDSAATHVAAQAADSSSLLTHYRRLVHLRRREPALGRGVWVPLDAGTDGVAAFLRGTEEEAVLVAVNLRDRGTGDLTLSGGPGSLPAGVFHLLPIPGFTPPDLEATPRTVSDDGFGGWSLPSVPAFGTVLVRVRAGSG
jgi:glycosidase